MEKIIYNRFNLPRSVIAVLGCLLCVLCIAGPGQLFAAGKSQRVLLLCSYHQGDEWTNDVVRGVTSGLDDTSAELSILYLDVRRHSEPDYAKGILALLDHQHRTRTFNVIITADDPALSFLLEHRDRLFRGTPIVFCGVNDFKENRIAAKQELSRG